MAPKKLLILGATGPSGVATVNLALAHGHTVIIHARNPAKLSAETLAHPNIKIFKGELTDTASLSAAFAQKPDTVISLLGPTVSATMMPWTIGDTFTDGYRRVMAEMRSSGVKRILAMGTMSIYVPEDKPSFGRAFLVWLVYLIAYAAWRQIIGISELFKNEAQGLDWTVFRIGNLGRGPVGEIAEGYIGDGNTSLGIQRSELAEWLVAEAEKDDSRWIKGFPCVSTALKNKV